MYNPYTAGSHCVLRCSNSQQHYLGSQVRSHVENSWSSTLVTTLAVLGHTVWRLMVTSSWPGSPAGSRLQQVPITTQQRPFLDYQTLWSLKSKMTCCPPDSVLLFPSCHNHPHPCPLDNLVVSYFPLNIVVAAVFFLPWSASLFSPVPLASNLTSAPQTISAFPDHIANVLVAWQSQPPTNTNRRATVSHKQPDFNDHNFASTILLFLSLAVCVCVFQSLFCAGPPLLSVSHRWNAPHTFPARALLMVRRLKSCREERDCGVVWACCVKKFQKAQWALQQCFHL